jgi:hypothetical protein
MPYESTHHELLITDVLNITPPDSIFVYTSDGILREIFLTKVTANAAHYIIDLDIPMTILSGYALIDSTWDGNFVESWGPLAVTLTNFYTVSKVKAIEIQWETVMEIDNAGYNLYRSTNPDTGYIKLNQTIIPPVIGFTGFNSYIWVDDYKISPRLHYWYILEDLDFDGTTTYHGPITGTSLQPNGK